MAYIDWWNRTGPITMGERFGLNEISTRAKTLSPTKSYASKLGTEYEDIITIDDYDRWYKNPKILEDSEITEEMRRRPNAAGGRIGFKDAGIVDNMVKRYNLSDAVKQDLTTLYKDITNQKSIHTFPNKAKTAVIEKRLTDFATEFKRITGRLPVANEIVSFGAGSVTVTSTGKSKYLTENVNFIEETDLMKKTKRIDVIGTEIEKTIVDAYNSGKYTKADGTPNIKELAKDIYPDKPLDDARKQIRKTLKRTVGYEGVANIEGEMTSAKKSRITAQENIALAETKAGKDTVAQTKNVINSIKKLNDPYKEMSVKDIAKDKNLLKRLRLQINSTTGNVNFNGYTKLDVNKKNSYE